jgi:hypothetical protein
LFFTELNHHELNHHGKASSSESSQCSQVSLLPASQWCGFGFERGRNGRPIYRSTDDLCEAPVAGIRVKMSARPLLERMNFDAALAAHLGTGFMDNFMIEQIQGGPNDGMFVAHDAVAKLLGTRADNASRMIKKIACPVPEPRNDQQREENRKKEENFSSYTLLQGANVSLVNFLFCTIQIFILI